MASFVKFNIFVENVANGAHNLGSDTLKILLTNTAPSGSTSAVKGDLTEISTGGGYAAGGLAVGSVTSAQTSGTYKLVATSDPSLTASGDIGPFRYAVLYNNTSTAPNKPLIGYWDYGSSITLHSGDSFTVDLDQSNGILQLA